MFLYTLIMHYNNAKVRNIPGGFNYSASNVWYSTVELMCFCGLIIIAQDDEFSAV